MILYHFTCEHALRRIGDDNGLIVPHYQPFLDTGVVWMTHDPHATRDALGLSSVTLGCDRMFARFEIPDPEDAVPWNAIRHHYKYGHLLEAVKGTRPDLWWVSRLPQRSRNPVVTIEA